MIFAAARARPTVWITSWRRRFWAANTCSTLARTFARVALPHRMCAGIGLRLGFASWNCGSSPPSFEDRQVGLRTVGGSRPDAARQVVGIEQHGELAAVVRGGVGDRRQRTKPCVRSMPTWFL